MMSGHPPDVLPAEQEFVVHLFAPTDGPAAAEAFGQIQGLWQACRDRLGLTQPISGTGSAGAMPLGARTPNGDGQALMRREHDVLNLSVAFTRRDGRPATWAELDSRWDEVAGGRTDRLLGVARLYLGKVALGRPDRVDALPVVGAGLREHVPGRQEIGWWGRGRALRGGFAVWETSMRPADRAERRIVVLGQPRDDALLSAWTWSRGDPDLPALAIYLMHAARLRYHIRVWAEGRDLARLRQVVDWCTRELLRGGSPTVMWRRLARLEVAEAEIAFAQSALRDMRLAVQVAGSNMAVALGEDAGAAGPDLFQDDLALAAWFEQQLDDHTAYLESARERAERVGELGRSRLERSRPDPETRPPGETEIRMGFAFDVVGYGLRTDDAAARVQSRLKQLVGTVIPRLGFRAEETDWETSGDGMTVFLPSRADCRNVVPALILAVDDALAQDNAIYRDRIRLRMSTAIGPTGEGTLGFSGGAVVELARLLDSLPLRQAVVEHADSQLVVLVSDQLYGSSAQSGHGGLDADAFRQVRAEVKNYESSPWLWVSTTPSPG